MVCSKSDAEGPGKLDDRRAVRLQPCLVWNTNGTLAVSTQIISSEIVGRAGKRMVEDYREGDRG